MNKLISNRTEANVNYAITHQSSEDFLRGAYNYTDLNRIEEWCEYIETELNNAGYRVEITTKTDWTDEDFPTQAELERIRSNVALLKQRYYSHSNVPIDVIKMTFKKANELEKVLDEIYHSIWGMGNYYIYSGVCNSGQPRVWQNRFRHFYEPISITRRITYNRK